MTERGNRFRVRRAAGQAGVGFHAASGAGRRSCDLAFVVVVRARCGNTLGVGAVTVTATVTDQLGNNINGGKVIFKVNGKTIKDANGKVILYADTISLAMQVAIDETIRRRTIQNEYNIKNGIVPKTIIKEIPKSITIKKLDSTKEYASYVENKQMTKEEKAYLILELEEEMKAYAKDLNFEAAAQIRDAILELKASK